MEKTSDCIVIIPAYNEEKTIEEVVTGAKRYVDVCVIDDCSSDATPVILRRIEKVHVIRHKRNTHIPGCLLDGMRYAVENGYDYAISMDAGLSHNPDEIPLFLNSKDADLVIGFRKERIDTPAYRRALSSMGNIIYNICLDFPGSMFGRYLRDITSGFRKYSKRAMRVLLAEDMKSRSFDIMIESAHFIIKHNLTISEVPITYRFTTSSLNSRVILDCMKMCFKLVFGQG